jgi:hypothetical protein
LAGGLSAQSKLVRRIEQSQFFATLLLNKSRLQSFTDPSVKGSVSAYLNAVNANPQCVRPDSFITLRNEYYRIIDGVNGSLDGIIGVVQSINTIGELRNITGAKNYIDSINYYAGAAPALFVRLIRAEGQVAKCNYGSGVLLLERVISIAMPFLNSLFAAKVKKVKAVIVQKLEQLKFDRMTAMWEAAAVNIGQQTNGGNLQSLQVVSRAATGQTELTREGAFRELGLSPAISCYTVAQVKQAYDAKLAELKEIWDDPDFVRPEEKIRLQTRLLDAYSFLLNLFAGRDCNAAGSAN